MAILSQQVVTSVVNHISCLTEDELWQLATKLVDQYPDKAAILQANLIAILGFSQE